MAVPGRLELPTFGLGNRCSIRLSYGTIEHFQYLSARAIPARYFLGTPLAHERDARAVRANRVAFLNPRPHGASSGIDLFAAYSHGTDLVPVVFAEVAARFDPPPELPRLSNRLDHRTGTNHERNGSIK